MALNIAVTGTSQRNCVIESLLKRLFDSWTFVEKKDIISKGRPTLLLKDLKSKASGGFNQNLN
jgi:tRNA splicing ligase